MKKKMRILILSSLMIIGLSSVFCGSSIAEATSELWNSCPRDRVNCAYPGDCGSYIDTNSDSICDRSQSNPLAISESSNAGGVVLPDIPNGSADVGYVASISDHSQSVPLEISDSSNAGSVGTSVTSSDSENMGYITSIVDNSQNILADTGTNTESDHTTMINVNRSYYFIPIFVILGIMYGITWILANRKTIKKVLHRKIWNLVLLASTVVSALLGLFLIINIDFNINITLPFNMLFWHVEAGIALGIVAVFHILWHWRYFAKMAK
jgi:hypothetical protein